MNRGLAGHQSGRDAKLGDRLFHSTECQEARSREQVGGSERRIETGRRTKFSERIRVPPALLQDDAEVVANEGAIPAISNHAAKRGFSSVELTRRQGSDAIGKRSRQRRREILCRRTGWRSPDRKRQHQREQQSTAD
jgi:hypothetical protein